MHRRGGPHASTGQGRKPRRAGVILYETVGEVNRLYLPSAFAETRVDVLHDLMRAHPFATVVVQTAEGLDATHMPVILKPDPAPYGTIEAHIARANPMWSAYNPAVEALVIFQGIEGYITPSWYATKAETGRVVPTWNYVVVHAYGPLRVIEDRDWLLRHVSELTDICESGRVEPWAVSDAPADFTEQLLGAVVGIEISITRLLGKWKMSQNRPARDREGVVAGLRAQGDERSLALARAVVEANRGAVTR